MAWELRGPDKSKGLQPYIKHRCKPLKRGIMYRDTLAAPVGSVLFFAGEATHPAINPCMQAALETGERAAEQVLAHRNATCSKL